MLSAQASISQRPKILPTPGAANVGWLHSSTTTDLIGLGLMLGAAGASFAVALPLASRWYPPRFQGLALGIAGAHGVGARRA